MKLLVTSLMLLTLTTFGTYAKQIEGLSIEQGALSHSSHYVFQVVSVSNKSARSFKSVKIECAFFGEGKLVASGVGYIDNLDAGELGSVEIAASSTAISDSTKCRLVENQ